MKKNVGSIDRIVRFGLALILFSLYFLLEGNLKYIAIVGFIPLLTASFSFCPLYSLIGINSCQLKK